MKYDIEKLEADLLALVKAELPAKLTEITAEKADSITSVIPVDADYINTTDDFPINRKLIVYYGLTDGDPFSISAATSQDNRYAFLVYLYELNQTPGVVRKMLFRYIRALEEIFKENFDRLSFVSNMSLAVIAPTSAGWDKNEKSPVYKVGGVYIETSLAS